MKKLNNKPWLTHAITVSGHVKHKLYKNVCADRENKEKFNAYKHYRNKLNSIIRALKAKYINDFGNNHKKDFREVWKVINSLIGISVVNKRDLINMSVDDLNNFLFLKGLKLLKNCAC